MKKYKELLHANKRTIFGIVGAVAMIILSVIETYSSSTIIEELQMILISVLSYFNLRGVVGRGFESVEQFLKVTSEIAKETKEKFPE